MCFTLVQPEKKHILKFFVVLIKTYSEELLQTGTLQQPRPCGATVARLTPDQKVVCSNHIRVKHFL